MLTMPLRETAGSIIQTKRFELDLTLKQVAEQARVSEPTIIEIEQGRRLKPHGRTVHRIAKVLGLDPADLFDGVPSAEQAS